MYPAPEIAASPARKPVVSPQTAAGWTDAMARLESVMSRAQHGESFHKQSLSQYQRVYRCCTVLGNDCQWE